jgi:hypothetical protein
MGVVFLESSSQYFAYCNIILFFFKLQSFLEKDNFIIKSTNAKKNVRLCLVGIQKQNAKIKKFNKNKIFALFSSAYSISLREDLN